MAERFALKGAKTEFGRYIHFGLAASMRFHEID